MAIDRDNDTERLARIDLMIEEARQRLKPAKAKAQQKKARFAGSPLKAAGSRRTKRKSA